MFRTCYEPWDWIWRDEWWRRGSQPRMARNVSKLSKDIMVLNVGVGSLIGILSFWLKNGRMVY